MPINEHDIDLNIRFRPWFRRRFKAQGALVLTVLNVIAAWLIKLGMLNTFLNVTQSAAISVLLVFQAFIVLGSFFILLVRHSPTPCKSIKQGTHRARRFYRFWLALWACWGVLYVLMAAQEITTPYTHFALYAAAAEVTAAQRAAKEETITAIEFIGMATESPHNNEAKPSPSSPQTSIDKERIRRYRHIASAMKTSMTNPLPEYNVRSVALDEALKEFRQEKTFAGRLDRGWGIALTVMNNCQSLVFILLYWRLTVRSTDKHDHSPLMWGLLLLALFTIVHVVVGFGTPLESKYFGWASGIAAGVTMAMFIGKLQSRIVGVPTIALFTCYFYAVIQPLWGEFEDDRLLMFALVSLALCLKILLFIIVLWLLDSGIFVAYFEMLHQANAEPEFEKRRRSIIGEYLEAKLLKTV